jgi:hypothetical protein
MKNLIMFVAGFSAYLVFASDPGWVLLGNLGILVAAIAVFNQTIAKQPIHGNHLDWVIPAFFVVISFAIRVFVSQNGFFGLEGLWHTFADGLLLLAVLVPFVDMYINLRRQLKIDEKPDNDPDGKLEDPDYE